MSYLQWLRPPPWRVVLLLLCSLNALLAFLLGKDLNWDLLNYHFYNGYALLTGRLDRDLAPAQMQTFLNPLLDVPLYLAIVSLPPVVVGMAYGFVQGLNGVAVWLIGRELLPIEDSRRREWVALVLAVLGGFGAVNMGELGGSMGDTLVSIPVLFSVALLLRKRRRLETAPLSVVVGWTALAGAISGIGAGLKMSAALYCAGFALGCLFLVPSFGHRLLAATAFAAGAVGSWLVLSGFWLWQMWSRFGDPFFPFVRLFNSRPEFAGILAAPDTRFLPKSAISAAFYPFVWSIDPHAVSETHFRDWRFPVLYVLLAMLAVRWCIRRWGQGRGLREMPTGPSAFLLVGGLTSYALWLLMFGVYRYLAPLEWLMPLGLALALMVLIPGRYRTVTIVLVLALMTVGTKPAHWGRGGWTQSYFGVEAPLFATGESPMVLIAGLNGLSFIVPDLPANVRVVRLQSNSFLFGMTLGGSYGQMGRGSPNQFDTLVKEAIASHPKSLYVMFDGLDARKEGMGAYELDAILRRLGLRIWPDSCRPVRALEGSSPLRRIFLPGDVQAPAIPSVTFCAVSRGPGGLAFASPEFRGDAAPIARLYFAYFTRTPDQAGLRYWVAQHKAGASLAAIADAFTKSPEFGAIYGSLTNEQFVALAYRNVLGREPDAAGSRYWDAQLTSGALTRGQMMWRLLESLEYTGAA